MHEKMNFNNISLLRQNDQIKFIIKNKIDYEYANGIIKKYNPKCEIIFQSVWGTDLKQLSTWILQDGNNVRIGFQLHKLIFGEEKGV